MLSALTIVVVLCCRGGEGEIHDNEDEIATEHDVKIRHRCDCEIQSNFEEIMRREDVAEEKRLRWWWVVSITTMKGSEDGM